MRQRSSRAPTAYQCTDSGEGGLKSTGPSLRRDNPGEAGKTWDNTKWNSRYARSCDCHWRHPQRSYKVKVHKGGGGARDGWHVCVGVRCHSASNSENSSRETVLEH